MGKPAARITDHTAHGAMVVTGQVNVYIGGRPAARVCDSCLCGGKIIGPGAFNVLVGGKPLARVADPLTCSPAIVTGETTVVVGVDPVSSNPEVARLQEAAGKVRGE